MTSQQILQADLLDILFEKRNKLYGAYSLRKNYSSHLFQAIAATALLVAAILFLVNPGVDKQKPLKPEKSVTLTTLILPEDKKPEPKPQKQPPQAARQVKQENLINNVKLVNVAEDPVATQEDLVDASIGSGKFDGPKGDIPTPPIPPGNGDGKELKEETKVESSLPSRQPQFPGGTEAWIRFLNAHLFPPAELEPGERRTVQIRFWVDEEGAVTNFKVVQSGGSEFDNEVIRVLKKMPKWMPALQNGKPVAISFTQPVTFAVAE